MPTGIYKRKNNKINKRCIICKEEFFVPKYREKTAKYCSKKCFYDGHSKNISGENNPMFGVKRFGKKNPNYKGGINIFKEKQRKKQTENRNNNPQLKLRHNVSNMINKRLKKRLLSKKGKSIISFLPYTIDELKQHLEKQFEPWMNWNNWGVGKGCWQIDHIKPDSLFNYKSVDDKEFQECWTLENLQPLDAIENIKKSNKY